MSNATATLPGVANPRAAAEASVAKLRALFAPYLEPRRRVDVGELLWTLLNDGERRFMCRVAKLEAELAAHSWRELPDAERADLLTAWTRLREWVGRVQAHLDRVGRR